MEHVEAIVLEEDGLAYKTERRDQTYVQPQKYVVERVRAAESSQNEIHEEDDLQQDTLVEEVLLQLDFASAELGSVLEQQVGQAVKFANHDV